MDLIITYVVMAIVTYIIGRLLVWILCRRKRPRSDGGSLTPCPCNKENCVCSLPGEPVKSAIAPIVARPGETLDETFDLLKTCIEGDLDVHYFSESDDYMRAEYQTRLWHFVDDLEARMDRAAGVIHVRSASRLGVSDFGVNRRRVERLRLQVIEHRR